MHDPARCWDLGLKCADPEHTRVKVKSHSKYVKTHLTLTLIRVIFVMLILRSKINYWKYNSFCLTEFNFNDNFLFFLVTHSPRFVCWWESQWKYHALHYFNFFLFTDPTPGTRQEENKYGAMEPQRTIIRLRLNASRLFEISLNKIRNDHCQYIHSIQYRRWRTLLSLSSISLSARQTNNAPGLKEK